MFLSCFSAQEIWERQSETKRPYSKSINVGDRKGYYKKWVEFKQIPGLYDAIFLSTKGNRIKVAYFTSSIPGKSLEERFHQWAKGKEIILYTSGPYRTKEKKPVGLTIDNGLLVNEIIENFDGLVLVEPDGKLSVSNLKNGNLVLNCKKEDRNFDLRNGGALEKQQFLNCVKEGAISVFQTHLLVHDDKVLVGSNAPKIPRERRFLAICRDGLSKETRYVLVNTPGNAEGSIQQATEKVHGMLQKSRTGYVESLVNFDTGNGDVYRFFGADGKVLLEGPRELKEASNLLVFYWE